MQRFDGYAAPASAPARLFPVLLACGRTGRPAFLCPDGDPQGAQDGARLAASKSMSARSA